ncbi:MAG: polymer-forming cytoskeletal protein [Chromatiales bacterium]|nr:polymer-forming cytoskeletal protein [Chromatiales bacterium]
MVGPSILVQGDMTGDEDLVIQGRVEGSISLKKNLVTVGKDGRVNATVNAQTIRVEGTVEGELRGKEQVVVTRTGSVSGNIVAPRVTLEDGCRFKGAIDMESPDAGGAGKVTDIMLGASVADDPGKKS